VVVTEWLTVGFGVVLLVAPLAGGHPFRDLVQADLGQRGLHPSSTLAARDVVEPGEQPDVLVAGERSIGRQLQGT